MQSNRLFSPFMLIFLALFALASGPGSRAQEASPMFMEEGFIFVYQDVRGRNMSEGEFAWMRPHKPKKRMRRIFTDILFVLSAPIRSDLCHPRSIPILLHGTL